MATESEHVFVTEFPSKAVSQVGRAFVTRTASFALSFAIVKVVEFGLSQVGSEGLSASADEPEHTDEQLGELMCSAADAHSSEGFASGLADAKALPWKSILKLALTILQGLLLSQQPPIPNPANDDTTDHPPV